MAIQDLTPFGTAPKFYEGLLGADETAALQKRAQIQGLLGAGLALARGMSSGGAPRSALQNILGSVAGGFQAAGGAYEGGLKNFQTQQQIQQARMAQEQAKMAQEQAIALQQDIQRVMQTPEVANNPSLVALLRADPKKALEFINSNMAISRAYNQQPQPTAPRLDGAEKVLPSQEAVAPLDDRGRLMLALKNLQGQGGEDIRKEKEVILKLIENLDKQEEKERKLTDFTNEDIRVANYLFPDRDPYKPLTGEQNKQVSNELQRLKNERARSGATTINMPSESERTAGYLATRLQNSLQQYQRVLGENPNAALPNLKAEVIKGVTRSEYLKNLATPESRQQVEAAQLDMIDAALTMATGSAYTREQLESTRRTLFPELGDKPATIRDKAKRLDDLLKQAAMTKAGRAAPAPLPSGSSLMNIDTNAIIQELEKRKKEGK
jgi:hypothetical protein